MIGQQEWQEGITFCVDKAVFDSTSRQILPMHTILLIKHDHKVLYYSEGA